MSSLMAWRAASLTESGAGKSGKPCERFTALCFNARRVISRMTDSVNCSALAEIMRREICAMEESVVTLHPKRVDSQKFKGEQEKSKARKLTAGLGHGARSGSGSGGRDVCASGINHAVELRVTKDDLHIFARLRERNGFDKLRNFFVIAFGFPCGNAVFACVIGRKRAFRGARQLNETFEIKSAQLDVVGGVEEPILRIF